MTDTIILDEWDLKLLMMVYEEIEKPEGKRVDGSTLCWKYEVLFFDSGGRCGYRQWRKLLKGGLVARDWARSEDGYIFYGPTPLGCQIYDLLKRAPHDAASVTETANRLLVEQ